MVDRALLLLHGALGGEALRVPLGVGAVVVDHVLALHPAHALLQGEVELLVVPVAGGCGGTRGALGADAGAAAGLAAGDGDAGVGPEGPVGGGEGRVGPVRLDAPPLRGPVVGVPEAGVEPHGLVLGERDPLALQVPEVPDRQVVHHEAAPIIDQKHHVSQSSADTLCLIKLKKKSTGQQAKCLHDVLGVPEDGVGVEIGGGVEPEAELLLPLALPLREHVGVQRVGLARHVAQELEVDLVVGAPLRREVVGGDGAGGVAGDELELHVDLAEEVLVLGLEARAGGAVEREREEAAAVLDLAAAVAPGDVELLVEAGRRRAGQQRAQQQRQGHPSHDRSDRSLRS
jgi:hypothetical protein